MTLHLQVEISHQRFLIDCRIIDKVLSARALLGEKNNVGTTPGVIVHEGFAHYVIDMRKKMYGQSTSLFLNSRLLTFKSETSAENVFLFEKVIDLYRGALTELERRGKSTLIIEGFVYQLLSLSEIERGIQQEHYYA